MDLPHSYLTSLEGHKSKDDGERITGAVQSDCLKLDFLVHKKTPEERRIILLWPDLRKLLEEIAKSNPEASLMFAQLTLLAVEAERNRNLDKDV